MQGLKEMVEMTPCYFSIFFKDILNKNICLIALFFLRTLLKTVAILLSDYSLDHPTCGIQHMLMGDLQALTLDCTSGLDTASCFSCSVTIIITHNMSLAIIWGCNSLTNPVGPWGLVPFVVNGNV